MQIKPPGLFSRGKISLGHPAPHINPDTLLAELTHAWAARGFQVYKSALIGVDVTLRKSGWTGIAIKIKQTAGGTELAYNAFSPSAAVRVLFMGLIPILIVNATSWKPLLREFEYYAQATPYFGGGQLAGGYPGGQAMLPQMTPYGHNPQYPLGAPQQAGYGQTQPQPQPQPQSGPPQYPCAQCATVLQWVAEYQRWYCGRCQQYQ